MSRIGRRAVAAATHAAVGAVTYSIGYRTAWFDRHDPVREYDERSMQEHELKAALLDHLKHEAYVKLAPSAVAGVGAFALIDIPAGVDPFAAPNEQIYGRERSVQLTGDELAACPSAVVDHLLDFHDSHGAHVVDGRVSTSTVKVNARGMVTMDASWYLNHGEDANVELDSEASAEGGFLPYRTTRRIGAGEELLLDYREALPGVHAQIEVQRQRAAKR